MSTIEAQDRGGARETRATNGNAQATVIVVKGRDQVRTETGWASRLGAVSGHRMSRAQAVALRDALIAALGES